MRYFIPTISAKSDVWEVLQDWLILKSPKDALCLNILIVFTRVIILNLDWLNCINV